MAVSFYSYVPAAICLLALWCPRTEGAVISVKDSGAGFDYISGDPVVLPAAHLSTNLFCNGARSVFNRNHVVRPAVFDSSRRLRLDGPGDADQPRDRFLTAFPSYLEGQQYVSFSQEVRHYTNYQCTVAVTGPATFYLLVDNRVNEFSSEKPYSDPVFGAPDTEWVLANGWVRVDTGLTGGLTTTNRGDYVAIDEGNNGTLNQVYSIFKKPMPKGGDVVLGTQFEGNIYCLVISTNVDNSARVEPPRSASAAVKEPQNPETASLHK